MERVQRRKEDRLGILAAAWIGALGGPFVGVLGTGTTLIMIGVYHPYGTPDGYYASGTIYGWVAGAFLGALVGLGAAAALVGRFGNLRGALVGGALGLVAAAVFGRVADGLAEPLEGAFLGDPVLAGLLGSLVFAAAGGVLAVALRSGSGESGRRAALRDLIAGGILGTFLGLLGGGLTILATEVWAYPALSSFGPNEGVVFGCYLGAAVGAGVSALLGTMVRRKARAAAVRGSPARGT